jgi:syntaxin 1B/2/3
MLGGTSQNMQNVISDIQDKYKDIQKIEESVEMIFNLFQDLAVLVQ